VEALLSNKEYMNILGLVLSLIAFIWTIIEVIKACEEGRLNLIISTILFFSLAINIVTIIGLSRGL